MGQYPVINLSLKAGKQLTFERSFEELKKVIADEYDRHKFILKDKKLEDQKDRYFKILKLEGNISDYSDSIKFLSQCLENFNN